MNTKLRNALVSVVGIIVILLGGLFGGVLDDVLRKFNLTLLGHPAPVVEAQSGTTAVVATPVPAATATGTNQAAADAAVKERVIPVFDLVRVEPTGDAVIAGQSEPGSTIEILSGSEVVASGKANEAGEWAIVLTTPLKAGAHDLSIRTTSPKGEVVVSSQSVAVSVPEGGNGEVLVVLNQPDKPSTVLQVPGLEEAQKKLVAAGGDPSLLKPAPTQVAATTEAAAPAASPTTPAADAAAATPAPLATAQATAGTETAATPVLPAAPAVTPAASAATTEVPAAPAATVEAPAAPAVAPATQPVATQPVATEAAAPTAPAAPATDATPAQPAAPAATSAQPAAATPAAPAQPAAAEPAASATAPAAAAPAATTAPAATATPATAAPAAEAAPATAAPTTPAAPAATMSGSVKIDAVEYENGKKFYAAGSGDANGTIRLYVDDKVVGDSKVDKGRWLFEGDLVLQPGKHLVRADEIDPDGKVLARSEVPFDYADATAVPAPTDASGSGTAQAGSGTTGEADAAQPKTLIIRKGDNLWMIAKRLYGHGVRYSTIYQANTDQIRDPDLIYPGQVFVIPKGDAAWEPVGK